MDYTALDRHIEKITSAMRAGRDFTDEVDAAIKWAYDAHFKSDPFVTEYNNLIRALAAKLAKAIEVAVPRTMKIIYRAETEAFARARGYPLESELKIKYEPAMRPEPSYSTDNYRKLFYVRNAKELAKGVQEKLHEAGYDVELELTSDDKDYSLYLWIV